MMRLKRRFFIFSIPLLAALLVSNCRKVLSPTEVDMAEYGWVLYGEAKYGSSKDWFVEAVFEDTSYKDGYNGLGWTYGKLGELDSSIVNFREGWNRAFRDTTIEDLNLLGAEPPHDVARETTGGLALAYHAKNNHERCILYGNALLAMTGDSAYTAAQGAPRWSFSRDQKVNARHIIWSLASSHYALGHFGKSLDHVHQLMLEPASFSPDSTKARGWWELSDKIEFLRDNL